MLEKVRCTTWRDQPGGLWNNLGVNCVVLNGSLDNGHGEKGLDLWDSWSGGKECVPYPGRFHVGDVISGIDLLLWAVNSKGCYNKYPS